LNIAETWIMWLATASGEDLHLVGYADWCIETYIVSRATAAAIVSIV